MSTEKTAPLSEQELTIIDARCEDARFAFAEGGHECGETGRWFVINWHVVSRAVAEVRSLRQRVQELLTSGGDPMTTETTPMPALAVAMARKGCPECSSWVTRLGPCRTCERVARLLVQRDAEARREVNAAAEDLLVRYVTAETVAERDELFLLKYAKALREDHAPLWEIRSIVADTLSDIARRYKALAATALAGEEPANAPDK